MVEAGNATMRNSDSRFSAHGISMTILDASLNRRIICWIVRNVLQDFRGQVLVMFRDFQAKGTVLSLWGGGDRWFGEGLVILFHCDGSFVKSVSREEVAHFHVQRSALMTTGLPKTR